MIFQSETISRDKLGKLQKNHTCAVCGEWLAGYLHDDGRMFIACHDWHRTHHEGIAKEGKLFEENFISRRERLMTEIGTAKTKSLEKYSYGALTTESEAMKVLETIWPKAPVLEKKKAAMLCVQYQLNPLMRHVFLIPFKTKSGGETWATVLGIQANRLIAHRAGAFSYVDDTPRVMTKEEQERVFGEVFEDRLWAITKLKDNQGNQAAGYGFWMKSESPYGTEKGNTKANMAFIRSERQAMDRLFAGKMPEQQFEVADERYLDTSTGEIVDVEPEPVPQPAPQLGDRRINKEGIPEVYSKAGEDIHVGPVNGNPPDEPEEATETPSYGKMPRPKRDPESLKTLLDAQKACHSDFGMQPAQFLKELNASHISDISDTAPECYRKIMATRCD